MKRALRPMDGAPLDARLPDCILATIVNMHDDDGLPTPLWVYVAALHKTGIIDGDGVVTSGAFTCIVLLVVVRYECFVTACLID